jgi:hypothetical protein
MKQVTKEMIEAGHAVLLNVLLETGHIAMSASLLERIYLSMEQASPQPQREWQGLTEKEVKKLADTHLVHQPESYEMSGVFDLIRAVAEKLEEKNT